MGRSIWRNELVERKFNDPSSIADRTDAERKKSGFRLLFRSTNVYFSYKTDEIADSGGINSEKYKKKKPKKLVFKHLIRKKMVKRECFTRNILHGIMVKSFYGFF